VRAGRACKRWDAAAKCMAGRTSLRPVQRCACATHHSVLRGLARGVRPVCWDRVENLVAHAPSLGERLRRKLVEGGEEAAGIVHCHLNHQPDVTSPRMSAAEGAAEERARHERAGQDANGEPRLVACCVRDRAERHAACSLLTQSDRCQSTPRGGQGGGRPTPAPKIAGLAQTWRGRLASGGRA
jgi:hypothetical protein